eukprot:363326-Chlamydomonas_euryale.AAC.4
MRRSQPSTSASWLLAICGVAVGFGGGIWRLDLGHAGGRLTGLWLQPQAVVKYGSESACIGLVVVGDPPFGGRVGAKQAGGRLGAGGLRSPSRTWSATHCRRARTCVESGPL